MKNGERKAASAADSGGNGVILFGVPCEYPMSDGSASLAMVVGLSSKYMGEVLFLESDSSLMYSFVIRKDGSYVVRDQGGKNESYFDRLYKIFDGQSEEAYFYIQQLTAAMNASEKYSVILDSGESRRTGAGSFSVNVVSWGAPPFHDAAKPPRSLRQTI